MIRVQNILCTLMHIPSLGIPHSGVSPSGKATAPFIDPQDGNETGVCAYIYLGGINLQTSKPFVSRRIKRESYISGGTIHHCYYMVASYTIVEYRSVGNPINSLYLYILHLSPK